MIEMLRRSADQSHLAERIAADVERGGEVDLTPTTPAEKSALELVLTELTWEESRGRLLPRLRDAMARFDPATDADTAPPERETAPEAAPDAQRTAIEAQHGWRSQLRAERGELEQRRFSFRGGKRHKR